MATYVVKEGKVSCIRKRIYCAGETAGNVLHTLAFPGLFVYLYSGSVFGGTVGRKVMVIEQSIRTFDDDFDRERMLITLCRPCKFFSSLEY